MMKPRELRIIQVMMMRFSQERASWVERSVWPKLIISRATAAVVEMPRI